MIIAVLTVAVTALGVIATLVVPFIENALGGGAGGPTTPVTAPPAEPPGSITTPSSPTVEPTGPNPSGPGTPVPPPGAGVPTVLLSDLTTSSQDVSANGYLGYSEPGSVSLRCQNSFVGESSRRIGYDIGEQRASRLTGSLKGMAIPSDRLVTVQMMIYVDDRRVVSERASSGRGDQPIPFDVPLDGASTITLEVRCNSSSSDDRGVFLDATLS